MISRKTFVLAGCILFGTFLFGVVTGGSFLLLSVKSKEKKLPPQSTVEESKQSESRRKPIEKAMLLRMTRVLDLDEAQSHKVARELSYVSLAFDALHRSTLLEMKSILDDFNHSIKAHLNEQQVALFDQHFSRNKLRDGLKIPPFHNDKSEGSALRTPRGKQGNRSNFGPRGNSPANPTPSSDEPD